MKRNTLAQTAARFAALLIFITTAGVAQETPEAPDPNDAVRRAAMQAIQSGPQTIELKNQATLELPSGYGFMPRKEAAALMEAMGNQVDSRFLGLVVPESDADWFVAVEYEPAGYIKDDDAKDWDADELLDSLKEGTESANEHRESMGLNAIEVTRWIERPAYDAPTHRLVWSAEIKDKDTDDPDPGINYNTYVLGREGYVSLNLVTSVSEVEEHKPAARELLGAVAFNEGKRYTDFNSSTDKVAAYGLAALVGGIAAKKLGLLAMLGVFFAKFAKIIIVTVAAAGGAVAKFFKGRNAQT